MRRFCTPFIPFRVAGAAASARHVTTTESRRARTASQQQLQRAVLSIERRALFTYLRQIIKGKHYTNQRTSIYRKLISEN